MSVPIHNLYELVHQLTENRALVYYFSPFGSRKISDICQHLSQEQKKEENMPFNKNLPGFVNDYKPSILCHDQEPLNFDLYNDNNLNNFSNWIFDKWYKNHFDNLYQKEKDAFSGLNLRYHRPTDWHKFCILLHSELNSNQVELYVNTGKFLCAFYWSHAFIARDWYRFAEYDQSLEKTYPSKKTFLCYALGKSGTRTYRTDFLKKCKDVNIVEQMQIESFNGEQTSSDHSALYNSYDICNTDISIVLETVFDDRIHLTEKTLRPIACGHPFIIANGPGTLAFLRRYGFQTFHPFINESYDVELDNAKRMDLIIAEMSRIANLSKQEKQILLKNITNICEHNKRLFFSKDFLDRLIVELKTNLHACLEKTEVQMDWKHCWKVYQSKRRADRFCMDYKKRKNYLALLRHLKKGGTLKNYMPPDLE